MFLESIDAMRLQPADRTLYADIRGRLDGLNAELDRLESVLTYLRTTVSSVLDSQDVDRLGTNTDLFLAATTLLVIEVRDFIHRTAA